MLRKDLRQCQFSSSLWELATVSGLSVLHTMTSNNNNKSLDTEAEEEESTIAGWPYQWLGSPILCGAWTKYIITPSIYPKLL